MHSVREDLCGALGRCKDCEPVEGDFSIKRTGMAILSQLCDIPKSGVCLEVGCGSGVNSAFLSQAVRRVIATDLPSYDGQTHSLGIDVADGLLRRLDINNVELVSCSGERLPFADNSFDLVFSSSVLEHIDDKERALKEMFRVVRPGGRVICIIPTYVQSLCAFAHLYLYIARRIMEVAATKMFRTSVIGRKTLLPTEDDSKRASSEITGSFKKSHPSFPLPEPHGSYKNIFEEFGNQLPWRWASLARKCGAVSTDGFAFLFLPFNILEIFSTRLIARLYALGKPVHCMLARSWLKNFAYSYCVVAKK